ncbi:hypothetical protein TSUD_177600 [Trifolium subterraneum]|uniref:DUF674 family protein n=1 Tax=Trifolium subterraneum TaxID=3900 RepID=A0A2Z6P306_TRISU|nr:hypothetical protein TSUD_177600 [Trifolium subterraneum]
MAATASDEQGDKVPIKVLVDKEKCKVLFAEATKDFVDVLFSFLTLPLGTIARLVAEESNIEAVKFGSISSLYQSVANLDERCLWNQTCKEMLLRPRNSMDCYCRKLKLNIDETECLPYFLCEDNTCRVDNRKCVEDGFVKETMTFIISDDLFVMPNLLGTSINLLQKLGVNDINTFDKQTVIDLLKLSLISKTPLSDFIFKKEQFIGNLDPRNVVEFWIGLGEVEEPCNESDKMTVNVLRRKSNQQILFVEGKEDFADFLFSFLTFPLGGVLHMLVGFSSISCIDNLYKSVTELSSERCLRSQLVKDTVLTEPYISLLYELKNRILPIPVSPVTSRTLKFVDPKSPISGGFTRGPISFMVTDGFVVTPTSSISGLAYLEKINVPLNDVEESVMSIGRKEGLSILKASLTSTSAITNGLGHSIIHQFLLTSCSEILTMAANVSDEQSDHDQVPLTVLVDREKRKVLFAEAGNDFVDVLLSFLTLPLGTIARLIAKESNIEAVRLGSLSSLYESVSVLDEKYLWSCTCKEMLLQPRNSMDKYFQKMKLNIDDTEPLRLYYLCENSSCKSEQKYCVGLFKNLKCFCGKPLNRERSLNLSNKNGFVKETSTFIVSDDLYVMPNIVEVVDILKLALVSKTPLSDFIFKTEQFVCKLDPRNRLDFWIEDVEEQQQPSNDVINVKVIRRKSDEHILFVEVEEKFAEFLFSFLTFPLGAVLHKLKGISFLSCIDNLYKSMTELCSERCLRSHDIKDLLTNPCIAIQFELQNQIVPIPIHVYKIQGKSINFVDPKSPISGGYTRGPLTFMVTDDLDVTPMSSVNVVSYLEKMKVPLNEVEERVIRIGVKEGLSLLKASLTTTSALTNGFSLYIMEQFVLKTSSVYP